MRLKSLVEKTAGFDAPLPPRKPPPLFVPPWDKDKLYVNGSELTQESWERLIPDLEVLDNIFSPGVQARVRPLSVAELGVIRKGLPRAFFRSFPVPFFEEPRLAFWDGRRFVTTDYPHGDAVFLTTGAYPQWLANAESRAAAFEAAFLFSVNLTP